MITTTETIDSALTADVTSRDAQRSIRRRVTLSLLFGAGSAIGIGIGSDAALLAACALYAAAIVADPRPGTGDKTRSGADPDTWLYAHVARGMRGAAVLIACGACVALQGHGPWPILYGLVAAFGILGMTCVRVYCDAQPGDGLHTTVNGCLAAADWPLVVLPALLAMSQSPELLLACAGIVPLYVMTTAAAGALSHSS